MSTPFDFESADYLDSMIDIYKISSSDLTNIPFIKHIASKGKPVYISTGAVLYFRNRRRVKSVKRCRM